MNKEREGHNTLMLRLSRSLSSLGYFTQLFYKLTNLSDLPVEIRDLFASIAK